MIKVYHEGILVFEDTPEKMLEDNQGDEYVAEQIEEAKAKGVHEFGDPHIGNWRIEYRNLESNDAPVTLSFKDEVKLPDAKTEAAKFEEQVSVYRQALQQREC